MRTAWTRAAAAILFFLLALISVADSTGELNWKETEWGGKDVWLKKSLASAFPPLYSVFGCGEGSWLFFQVPLRLEENARVTLDAGRILQEEMEWLLPAEKALSPARETEKKEEASYLLAPLSVAAPAPVLLEPAPAAGSPVVAIYNTHNAEGYIPTDGQAKREGENASIAEVAQYLGDLLEKKHGIPAVVDRTIHDYPDWNKSYTQSRRTMVKLLREYPGLRLVLDIHRDSLPGNDSQTVSIGGRKAARILFVVGSYQPKSSSGAKPPNLALAEKLSGFLDEDFPGLSRGVRIKPGTYNQDLHPGALLIEIGNTHNSLEEARRAAEALAEALARWLRSGQST